MAHNKRLGSVASQVFAYGDTETMTTGDTHDSMLSAFESMERHSVRESGHRFVGRLQFRRDGVAEHLAARAKHRVEMAEKVQDRISVVERWRAVGIRERMTLRTIPKASKFALWLLIAALDFYIFAQVIAYAEDIPDPGPDDAAFWLGGAVGLTVFIVGILLAQAIRRAAYYLAQKRLLKEMNDAGEDTTGLRLSNYSRGMTFAFALFYLLLTAGAVVLRYQGGGKTQPGLLMLQTAIPVVAIMLELLIDDPTEVRTSERGTLDWYLETRKRRLDRKIANRQLIASEREGAVGDRYRFERAVLTTMHESHGIIETPRPEAMPETATQPEAATEPETVTAPETATAPEAITEPAIAPAAPVVEPATAPATDTAPDAVTVDAN